MKLYRDSNLTSPRSSQAIHPFILLTTTQVQKPFRLCLEPRTYRRIMFLRRREDRAILRQGTFCNIIVHRRKK